MTVWAAWCGFVGAWVLVTGSVFQGALELGEVTNVPHDRRTQEAMNALAPPPPPVSPWWWLLPPVGYALNAARTRRWREDILRHMDPLLVRQMVRFGQKATGWLLVSVGGFAIAVKETAELAHVYELPVWAWLLIVVGAAAASFLFTVLRVRRFERYLALRTSGPDAESA